jgi:hypothetical protein
MLYAFLVDATRLFHLSGGQLGTGPYGAKRVVTGGRAPARSGVARQCRLDRRRTGLNKRFYPCQGRIRG